MAADYLTFRVIKETTLGVPELVGAGIDVFVRLEGEVADVTESPLTTDANGEIVAGTIAAATVGEIAYFRIEDEDGLAGVVAQTLT